MWAAAAPRRGLDRVGATTKPGRRPHQSDWGLLRANRHLRRPWHPELPIVQAPIQGPIGDPTALALPAAVCNAGGLGVLPLWRAEIDTLRARIRDLKLLTSKPFAVNLNLEFPQEERLDACIEEGVPAISFFWGNPRDWSPGPRRAVRSSFKRCGPRAKRKPRSSAASTSSWRRAGKRAAMCAARWRR